jgi:hypothetical protein
VPRRPIRPDSGASAVALLVVLLVLGGVAALVFALQPGSNSDRGGSHANTTINGSPAKASSDIAQAAEAACQANFQTVQTAVSEYEALHGQAPTSMTALASMVHNPVSTYFYAITIDPHHPGQIEVATPGHAASPGEAGCAHAG